MNHVVLAGALMSVVERTVGGGRTLYELRIEVAARAGPNRGPAAPMIVPITTWVPEVGLACQALAPGTPVVVVGRVSARTWTPPSSGPARVFTEIVAEQVTVDVAAAAGAPSGASRPGAGVPRDTDRPAERDADAVPF